MPVHIGRLQVDQICESPRHLVEARLPDPAVGLGVDNGDGCIGGGGIQRSTGPSAYHFVGKVRPADALEDHSLARDRGEGCRQGYVFAG